MRKVYITNERAQYHLEIRIKFKLSSGVEVLTGKEDLCNLSRADRSDQKAVFITLEVMPIFFSFSYKSYGKLLKDSTLGK